MASTDPGKPLPPPKQPGKACPHLVPVQKIRLEQEAGQGRRCYRQDLLRPAQHRGQPQSPGDIITAGQVIAAANHHETALIGVEKHVPRVAQIFQGSQAGNHGRDPPHWQTHPRSARPGQGCVRHRPPSKGQKHVPGAGDNPH